MKKWKTIKNRLLAFLLSIVTIFTTMCGGMTANAATTVKFNKGETLPYGTLWTNFMTFDGDNIAYCVEPKLYAPDSGTYTVTMLGQDSSLRKALYYLYGGYGYEKVTKAKYFSGWSKNDIYIVSHLVVSYINDGYSSGDDAFLGATERLIDKAIEVANGIKNLPAPHKSFKAWIRDGGEKQTLVGSWYSKPMGYVEITKYSANESVSDGNRSYSLAGAKYGIYSGDVLVATLTTDEKGYAKSGELEVGKYTIKEMTASNGFAVDVNDYNVEVEADKTTSKKVPETPQVNLLDMVLQKVDTETGKNEAQGKASLANAEFTVKYYDIQSDADPAKSGEKPLKTWVFKTDKNGQIHFTKEYLVSGDSFYTQADGQTLCVPLGTVTIQETKAPTGYKLNEKVFVQKITSEGTKEVVNVYQAPNIGDQVYRGDLKLVKVSDSRLERLANVPFKITSVTTGESHVIVTDVNGYADTSASWNPHTRNTNAGKTSKDGVWFGPSEPDNSKGALPYDDYVIEELRCEANEGMNLLKFDVSVYKDSTTIDLGTLTNDKIDIATTAMDEETEINMSMADEKVTLIDTVEYENLKKGQTYKVVGILMDKSTGKELLVNGKKVTAEAAFKAKLSTGSVDVTFEFDGSGLKGKTIVVFEELYQEDLLLAVHADIEDEDQTIYFPEIGTTAKDSETEIGLTKADEKVIIIDIVEYKNLIPNKEYKVVGVLMDQETGKELFVDGKKVTSEQVFKPQTSSGTVEMTFMFDATGIIIDPEREYSPLVKALGGEVINISATSDNHINALDMSKDYGDGANPIVLKSEFILSLCDLVMDKHILGPKEKSIIDRCTANVYRHYRQGNYEGTPPTLQDLRWELLHQKEPEAREVALAIEMFTDGSLNTFAKETNVNTENRLICYDILDLGKALMPIGMLVVLDSILNRITSNRAKGKMTYIFIDEIYLLFLNEYSANFLFTLWKRVRKYNAFCTGITQNVEDLLQTHTARTMLGNSEFIIMLNQFAEDREELARLMGITDDQLDYITDADAGNGLIKVGGALVPFVNKFPKNTQLYRLMSTKAGERL